MEARNCRRISGNVAVALAFSLAALAPPGCKAKAAGSGPEPSSAPAPEETRMESFRLASSAFSHMGAMPSRLTCEGKDASPPLSFGHPPAGTKSFALVIDDPDAPDPAAPKRVWVHWVLFNLPPTLQGLAEGAAERGLPEGTLVGKNDWGKAAYGGPCPPIGRHRYFHKLYALDTTLSLGTPTKKELEAAMEGHILGKAELVGTYQKGG